MFIAALTSRSYLVLQPLHVHSLSLRVSSLLIYPQELQVLLLGSNLPMTDRFFPCHSALYSSILKNNAKILTPNEYSEKIKTKEKPYNHQDKESIVNYVLVNGYDGVDLSYYFNENEIRIFNIDVIK